MTPSKYLALSLAVLTGASAEVIFTEDFENESPENNAPYKAPVIRPKHNVPGKATFIVGESKNKAGSGKAVCLVDQLGGSGDSIGLEYDFVDSSEEQLSALRIDFSLSKWGLKAIKNDKLYFGAGEYNGSSSAKMSSKTRRYFQIELIDTNEVKFNSDSGKDTTESLIPDAQNTIVVVVNDYDNKAIDYAHPVSGESTSLEANMVAYYLNGKLVSETSLDLEDVTAGGTIGSSENNFGRFGFYSATKSDNNAWVFDDIKVTKL